MIARYEGVYILILSQGTASYLPMSILVTMCLIDLLTLYFSKKLHQKHIQRR